MLGLFRLSAAVMALAALSACVEDTGGSTAPGMMPASPNGPPFIEGTFGASQAATNACQTALQSQVNGGVMVVGSEFSQANSAVYMRVGSNGAPWRCLVGDDGSNPELMFMGSEGAA